MSKIIYYYQTMTDLTPVYINTIYTTHIHLSSIHFGYNSDNTPYIHLNDDNPYDNKFDTMWNQLNIAKTKGIKIILMIGGAGCAYGALFSNYNLFYPMLLKLINDKYCIGGVDLDIEEECNMNDVIQLICDISRDTKNLPNFIISMAPVSGDMVETKSLYSDVMSMIRYNDSYNDSYKPHTDLYDWTYKDLYNTPEGQRIDYFNVQAYDGDFNKNTFNNIVANGFPAHKIIMGCTGQQFSNWTTYYNIINSIDHIGGVFLWEYCLRPTDWDYYAWLALK